MCMSSSSRSGAASGFRRRRERPLETCSTQPRPASTVAPLLQACRRDAPGSPPESSSHATPGSPWPPAHGELPRRTSQDCHEAQAREARDLEGCLWRPVLRDGGVVRCGARTVPALVSRGQASASIDTLLVRRALYAGIGALKSQPASTSTFCKHDPAAPGQLEGYCSLLSCTCCWPRARALCLPQTDTCKMFRDGPRTPGLRNAPLARSTPVEGRPQQNVLCCVISEHAFRVAPVAPDRCGLQLWAWQKIPRGRLRTASRRWLRSICVCSCSRRRGGR